ncbi:MAG TPA: GAF domain-containing protein, partial [Anaerolineae bacterium]
LDPAMVELAYELQRRYSPDPNLPGGLPYVLRTGESWLYADLPDEIFVAVARNAEHLNILRRLQVHSIMIVPLKAHERVLGALTLASSQSSRPFGPDELALAEQLAHRAALAVENARLYSEASRLNEELDQRVAERTAALQRTNAQLEAEIAVRKQAEERIRLQATRTAALVRTAARLNARLDLDAVLRAVGEETARALDIPVVTVSLYDARRHALVPAYTLGLPTTFDAKAEPLPRHIYDQYTQQMGHLVVISDVQTLTDLPNAELYRAFDIRTTVSASMLRQGELMGRLNIGSTGEVRNFSEDELALLQGLADQAAQAIANARDVEERRRAEETLRKSQMQLAEAQKIARLGSWEWNITSNTVTWSDEMYRIFGFQPGAFAVTYDKFLELVYPDDRHYTHQMIQEASQTRRPYNFYHRIVRPNGSVRILQARGQVVLDEADRVVAMVGTGQDVTELKQAEAQLERQAQQLAAIGQMGLALTATLELSAVLRRVLEQVSPLLPAEGISVLLLEGDELIFAATNGPGATGLEGQRMPATAGVAGDVIQNGRSVLIEDTDNSKPLFQVVEETNSYQVRSLLAVPLKLHGELAGVIEAVHSQPEIFSTQDLQLLEAAASWTAIAISNARQHEQTQQRLQEKAALVIQNTGLYEALGQEKRRLELLYNLSHNLATTLNPRTVASRALNLTMKALGAFKGEIFVLQPDSQRLELVALSGYDATAEALIDDIATLGLGEGLAGLVAQTRVAVAVPNVRHHPNWLPWPGLDDDAWSAAAVPLLASDTLVGVLILLSEKQDFFTDEHLPLLRAVATPVALSLQNARLYETEHRAHQVAEILRAANLALSQRLELDAILETLLEHVSQLVDYDSANVMLLSGKHLTMRAVRGYEKWTEPGATKKVAFDIETVQHLYDMVGRQESIIVPDSHNYPGWQPQPGIDHIRCWLGVPLLARGRVIGVLSLDKAEADFFNESHLQLVETLAAQATIAIENAHLFEQVHAGRERLRQLTKQVVSAQEEERQRVSRELHDEAGQALTALKISLDLTKASLPLDLESIRQSIVEAMELTDETMDRIRLLAQNLRPPALDTLGLNATLEGLCRDFAHRTSLSINYKGVNLPPLSDAVNISLYRFVQEALTNIAKHANASRVRVALDVEDAWVTVSVVDNGRGFPVEEQTSRALPIGGIGLVGMRERFELLGGLLEIESQPDQGTRLVACVPLRLVS